ncbi:PKS01 highly reducing polyketide synthase [Hypoxylon rubiginosum]|uniref:PKS01 highly reducing polyketide synthase n=1 Tax=Hypoxylon rubiginosum TaxID=110542 RepID=A0ACC0DJJ3_9PEZI|nr:PKS01 highly reducing polyketide synthase [Hypoxylon rubiginosum]
MAQPQKDSVSVAITGLSCRFPGDGDNLENFWESISQGKSAWSEIPADRFNAKAFWSANKKRNTSITTGAHFLRQDIALFDPNFFGISNMEASSMDPQQCIMIVAYEALETAGYSLADIAGTRTGVFMGHFTSDYKEMLFRDADAAPPYTATGVQKTSLANRLSWLFDLKGPSFAMDTACSSSLVALHLACQSLRAGESDIAIVGGTNLLLNPDMFMLFSGQNFLSPDGKCKSFDASGNGYGRGEGFAAVVLKRVDDAIVAGDPIRAVIRGTGSNQDGHTKGFTLPSADAQASLINDVYKLAGLDFSETGYVEAHGTGTQAGDTEETSGLARTLSTAHSPSNKLIVGSVKANIGHLEAVAGLAGVIKSVLMLERGMIPPNIHFHNPNPKIKFDEWNIKIPTELTRWPKDGLRRISINSFGYGGTNAHAIIDDAYHYMQKRGLNGIHFTNTLRPYTNGITKPYKLTNGHVNGVTTSSKPRLFPLSSQDRDGLKRVKKSLAEFVQKKSTEEDFVSDLAYTLAEKRSRLQWKSFTIASSADDLQTALTSDEVVYPEQLSSQKPRLGFVFTGQGAQWATMGMELMEYATFRSSIEAADAYLRAELECDWSAVEELSRGASTSKLSIALYSQTLCTVLQVALVDLLREWEITPVAVTGHSSGEIAAAYCMGALTKEDAWKVAYYRGILSSNLKTIAPEMEGAMMAVGASPEDAEVVIAKVCPGEVGVACINSPSSVTLSGDAPAINKLLKVFEADGIFARRLQVDTAYHSQHMQLVAQDYLEAIADIETGESSQGCKMHSSVTAGEADASELGAAHWVRNLISPVKFAPAIQDLVRPTIDGKKSKENAVDVLVEIGPHSALQGPATQSLKAIGITNMPYLTALVRKKGAIETALTLAGSLFTQGLPVDFAKINGLEDLVRPPKMLVDLPAYPWNHSQRYWTESRVAREYRLREVPAKSLIGAPSASLSAGERLWRGFVRLSEEPWVADHKIQGSILYPGAGFLAMAIEAALQSSDKNRTVLGFRLRDIQLVAAMVVTEDADVEYTVSLRPHLSGTREQSSTWTEFTISSSPDGQNLTRNCLGLIIVEYEQSDKPAIVQELELEKQAACSRNQEAAKQCKFPQTCEKFYQELETIGLGYGPAFTNVTELRTRAGQSYGAVSIPDVGLETPERPHVIHPGTLDAVFHLAFAAVNGGGNKLAVPMVPKSIDEVVVAANIPYSAGQRLKGFSNAAKHGFKELKADIVMLDEQETRPVLSISGFCCAEIAGGSAADTGAVSKKICSKLIWKPALDMLSTEELKLLLSGKDSVNAQLAEYIKISHHINPSTSILELAGTSSLLSNLDIADVLSTAEYTVACQTDEIKAGLQQSLADFSGINYCLDPLSEEIPEDLKEKSDLVIFPSSSSLSVESIISASLLLNKGGKICVIESVTNAKATESLLKNAGLLVVFESAANGQVLITASSDAPTEEAKANEEVVLILDFIPPAATRVLEHHLTAALTGRGYKVSSVVWGEVDVSTLKGKTCISLMELEQPFLENLGEEDFNAVKQLILDAGSVMWVNGLDTPASGMMNGVARVVRNEVPGIKLRTFNAPYISLGKPARLAEIISRVFSSGSADNELLFKDDFIQVSRVVEDVSLNDEMDRINPQNSKLVDHIPLRDAPSPLKLAIGTVGIMDTLCFERDNLPRTELKSDEVEIKVKATALNFREIMSVMGQIPDALLGFDAAGVIIRVGSGVTKFRVGDRVAMCGHGAHRTVHRSKAGFCQLLPDNLTFEQAASIPVVHGTAWYGLVHQARVKKGQSILIHTAAGGVGQAAIQVAQHYEMDIYATVGSEAKRALLRDTYGIADDHIFSSRDLSFVQGVKRMTNGRGVDVVLNSLAGEALRQSWYCIAPFGTFIEIGLKDILGNTRLDMRPFIQDATFCFFNLNHIERDRPELMAEIIEGAFDFIRRGITRPITPLVTYPISEVENAFRLMQTGKHIGKIALSFNDDDVVPVVRSGTESLLLDLDPSASYVLVGGLGGLGRSISTMLVDNGARKLCFLSRSGAASTEAQKLLSDLESRQVQAKAIACDVSDAASLNKAIAQCTAELGRVRGVIQCAMVLRDVLFSNMTHHQWVESTQPKVQGTWNLHNALPDVDFFVMLSSFAGIFGNRGQSNYAAGCAFQDQVAHYRRSRGRHALSLDVGLMRDIGVLAEKGITESLRDWEVPYGIRGAEFLDIMRLVIAGDASGALATPQVMTGFATGGSAVAAGIDQPFYLEDAKFAIMAQTGVREQAAAGLGSGNADSVQNLVAGCASANEAAEHVTTALVNRVSKMLQTPSSEIDTARALHSYGIDSLVAIEIVNWALKELRSQITVFDVMAAVPITMTALKIAASSALLSV